MGTSTRDQASVKIKIEVSKLQKNLQIKVTEEMLIKRAGGRLNERIAQCLPEVISLGESLLEPKTVYDFFAIEKVEEKVLFLKNGEAFGSKHLCKLLNGAEKLVAMCCTVGNALEKKTSRLNEEGDPLTAYLLDIYASTAVGFLMRSLHREIKKDYAGYGVTAYLEPGQLDWNIRDQEVLFRLVSPETIGVSINESFMMKPVKTTTGVFGIGAADRVKKGNFACKDCPKRKTCAFRHEAEELLQDDL
jgi:cobalamin-dependent methionine synthase I